MTKQDQQGIHAEKCGWQQQKKESVIDSLRYYETQIANNYPQKKNIVLSEVIYKQVFDNSWTQLLAEYKNILRDSHSNAGRSQWIMIT